MSYQLVVVQTFASHKIGDLIDDEARAMDILDGESRHHVVRVTPATASTVEKEG